MSDLAPILPPNANRTELALEQATGRFSPTDPGIAALWSPQTCPPELLPWLAWTLSVDDWDDRWSVAVKRRVLAAAVATHRVKGTVGAVRRALAATGMSIDIAEWWQTAATPHTFDLIAYAEDVLSLGVPIGPELIEMVQRTVDPVKPVRSHYGIKVGERFVDTAALRAGARQHVRQDMQIAPQLPHKRFATNPGLRAGARQRVRVSMTATPMLRPARQTATCAMRVGTRLSRRLNITAIVERSA